MIANKIVPSFYTIEIEGKSFDFDLLLGADFGIKKMFVESLDFTSNLHATTATKRIVDILTVGVLMELDDYQLDKVTQDEEFNPEFYPSLSPLELTDEQRAQIDDVSETAENMTDENHLATIITKNFDSVGDFVSSKITVSGPGFSIGAKVIADLECYATAKGTAQEEQLSLGLGPHREAQPQNSIH